jgi:hypothetical protein
MQTHLTAQQIRHFAQFGWIEFEEFLPKESCTTFSESIKKTLNRRVKKRWPTAEELYKAGRDVWRDDASLKKTLCSKNFSSSVSSLSNKTPLLLACDQWIPEGTTLSPLNMEEHLSFQGLICGALLSLDGDKAGHIRFCHPDRLPLFENGAQLVIAYGNLQTVYIHNPKDPCNSYFKELGYNFGDRLNTTLHPLC